MATWRVILLLAATTLGGCQTGAYDWGSYQDSMWVMYSPNAMDTAAVGKQIQSLESEITTTRRGDTPDKPSRIPPGKYAHLAYLYAMQGDRAAAIRCFGEEKRVYPESARFVDGMVARLDK